MVDSVISALKEVDAEASTSVYIWDKTANDGEGAYLNSVEDSIKYIAPFQAFWVRLLSSEASGISTLIQDEKKNGAVVIDLGANITSFGVFLNNKIIFYISIFK